MNLFSKNVFFTALALAVSGAEAPGDLGAKVPPSARDGGAGLGKNRVPLQTWLGVAIEEAAMEISARLPVEPGTGLVVNQVISDSPAAISGLQRGDVLARLNDRTLVTPKQLQTLVMRRKPGEQVEIEGWASLCAELRERLLKT